MRCDKPILSCMLSIAALYTSAALAAGPDICATLPIATVNELTHQTLTGVRADVSEEAHSFGCAYGQGGLVSVSVIRPGGSAAFVRTSSRYPKAEPVAGLGEKAIYDKRMGTIALFGDTVIAAFLPQDNLTDAQRSATEKSLILALQKRL
jgi:hypothetical protein